MSKIVSSIASDSNCSRAVLRYRVMSSSNDHVANEEEEEQNDSMNQYFKWLFDFYVGIYKNTNDNYFYTDDGITFLLPPETEPDLDFAICLYRTLAPFLLLVGTCGNVLSFIVMVSKGMR